MSRVKKGLLALSLVAIGALVITAPKQLHRRKMLKPISFVQQSDGGVPVALSTDGAVLITAAYRNDTRVEADGAYPTESDVSLIGVWNASTGQKIRSFDASGNQFWLSEDGHHLMTARFNEKTRFSWVSWFEVDSGKKERSAPIPGSVESVSRDLSKILSSDYQQTQPKKYERLGWLFQTTGKLGIGSSLSAPMKIEGETWSARFSRDNRFITIPNISGPSLLLRTKGLKPVFPLPPLSNLRISKDNKTLVGIDSKGVLNVWDIASRKRTQTPTGFTNVITMYLLPDKSIVTSGNVGDSRQQRLELHVRSADGKQLLRTIPGFPDSYSGDGRLIALKVLNRDSRGNTRGDAASFDIVDITTGETVVQLDAKSDPLGQPSASYSAFFERIWVPSNGKRFILSSTNGLLRFYDRSKPAGGGFGPVSNEDGSVVEELGEGANQSAGSTPNPFKNSKGESFSLFTGEFGIGPVTIAPKGQWDTRNRRVLAPREKKVSGKYYSFAAAKPSRDGRRLLVLWNGMSAPKKRNKDSRTLSGEGFGEIIDIESGRSVLRLAPSPLTSTRFGAYGNPQWSANDELIAMASETGVVSIWSAQDGRILGLVSGACTKIEGTTGIFAGGFFQRSPDIALSPDNRLLAVGRDDGSIYLYSLKTFLPVAQIGKAGSQLRQLHFSGDGNLLFGTETKNKKILSWPIASALKN